MLIGLDLDGTLEDSRDDMVAAAVRVRAGLGLEPREDSMLRHYVNGGMEQLYRRCFDDYLSSGEVAMRMDEVKTRYEADYLANVAVKTRLYEGIEAALRALVEFGTLACITNKPEHISRRLLDELGVGSLFTTVIGGDSCSECKPSPLMMELAAQHCGFERGRDSAFMIGDTAGDIKLGRAFGAHTVWCAWGYSDEPGAVADFQVQRPHELVAIVGEERLRQP